MADVAIVCAAGIVSGKEIMALELITGLRARSYIVDVVTSSWGSGEFRSRCEKLGFTSYAMRLGFISARLRWDCMRMTLHQTLYWPVLFLAYRRFFRASKPRRVIHTNWHHLVLLAPFLNAQRDIFWLHEIVPDKPQYRRVFGWLNRRLQYFVPVSQAVGKSLRRIGIPENKIRIIYNGLSDPSPDADIVASKSGGSSVVGIVGQIGRWKGHNDLLEAFAAIVSSSPAARLHIFGGGSPEYEKELKHDAISLGVAERVKWRGFVKDRASIYRDMTICVVPSRCADPLPTVAIEAAFFGIPVVATREGGLPEIVEDGVTGFLVDAKKPVQLASCIQVLLNDIRLRNEMGERARRRAIEKFSRDRFVCEFVRALGVE